MQAVRPSLKPLAALGPGLLLTTALALAGYALSALPGVKILGMLSVTLLLGIACRALLDPPDAWRGGIAFSARTLLRWGIVLMGARLDYGVILAVGPRILGLDAVLIAVGVGGLYALGRRFGLGKDLAVLLAMGASICGASAVAAASGMIRAEEETTSLAVALCGVLGTVGVAFYVLVGARLGLSLQGLGILTGSTLHETAQVLAAAFTWGPTSGDMGMLVKLTRVVLLAPALLGVGFFFNRGRTDHGPRFSFKSPIIPYFVLGFLMLGGVNSLGWLEASWRAALTQTSLFLMALAMAGMGLQTNIRMFAGTGSKAVGVGLIGLLAMSVLSYTLIKILGLG